MSNNIVSRLSSLLMAVALLSSMPTAAAAQSQSKWDTNEWERVALEELKSTNTPGAAVAVVSGDQVIYAKGFGVANVETGAPVTPDMLFRVGSMTKMFTAATLVGMAEEGKVNLSEPVGRYIQGLTAKISKITAHQLLSHTSGIRDEAHPYGPHEESALGATVRSWGDDYLFTEPGKIFSYSNANFAIAGLLIEDAGKKPFADLLTERLFKPLGMKRTTFRPTVAMTYPLAQGHQGRNAASPVVVRPFADNVVDWPAGFMFSSAEDIARFAIAFMNGGRIDGKQVLDPSGITKLSTPYVDIPGTGIRYGYGLRVEDYRGVHTVQHGGAIAGFGSQLIMVPERRFALIVLGNRSGARQEKTVDTIMAAMLTLSPKGAIPEAPATPTVDADVSSFVGAYANSPRRSFEVVAHDGRLYLKDEDGEAPLVKVGERRFLTLPAGSPEPDDVVFVAGSDGRTEYLHMNGRAFKRLTTPK